VLNRLGFNRLTTSGDRGGDVKHFIHIETYIQGLARWGRGTARKNSAAGPKIKFWNASRGRERKKSGGPAHLEREGPPAGARARQTCGESSGLPAPAKVRQARVSADGQRGATAHGRWIARLIALVTVSRDKALVTRLGPSARGGQPCSDPHGPGRPA
jgi:hypothetical protein